VDDNMLLDLSSFERAIAQVEEALEFAHSELAASNERLAFQLRASSILAFEYTYELSVKTVRRYLEATEGNTIEFDTMSFQQIMRLAYVRGLIDQELRFD
jgi:hypothetical protein